MEDFSLSDEERQIRDTVRSFIAKEGEPLEEEVLRNERAGRPGRAPDVIKELRLKARKVGFWGINTPEEYGGLDAGAVLTAILTIETGRTFVPFTFGGTADNILYAGTEEQKRRYLIPTIEGERRSCFAITEPGAGSDARNITTRAVEDARGDWIINGEKTFLTGHIKGCSSVPIPTMVEWGPASLVYDDVRVPHDNVLGEVGKGFELAMRWIGHGRFMIPARAIGSAERLLQMAIDYANIRRSMGHLIGEYQAIQWQNADSQVEIEAAKR